MDIESLQASSLREIADAASGQQLEDIRISVLGRNGSITALLKSIRDLPKDERPQAGARINGMRTVIEAALVERREALVREERSSNLTEEIDITLPGRPHHRAMRAPPWPPMARAPPSTDARCR